MRSNIPNFGVKIADLRGVIATVWFRFFTELATLTGAGNNNISLVDLQLTPPATLVSDQVYELSKRVPIASGYVDITAAAAETTWTGNISDAVIPADARVFITMNAQGCGLALFGQALDDTTYASFDWEVFSLTPAAGGEVFRMNWEMYT